MKVGNILGDQQAGERFAGGSVGVVSGYNPDNLNPVSLMLVEDRAAADS